jgi:hypothetical protein
MYPHCPRYLGVTVLDDQPAIIMELYPRGSLLDAIKATSGAGLQLDASLR